MARKRKRVQVPKRSFIENVKETAKLLKELRVQKRSIARDKAEREKKAAAKQRLKKDVAESKKSAPEKKAKTSRAVSVKPGSPRQVVGGEAGKKRVEKALEESKAKKKRKK